MKLMTLALAVCLLLSGCLGIEDTTTEARKLGDKLDDTKTAQQFGAALEIMSDSSKSVNIRVAAAETVFIKGAEDRVGKYVGMPAPIKMISVPVTVQDKSFALPNVAYIGNDILPGLDIAPVSEDLSKIQVLASLNLLKQMSAKSKLPGLTGEEIADLRSGTKRMIYLATAIQGSTKLMALADTFRGNAMPVATPEESKRREATAALLQELGKNLSLTEEELTEMKALIEARLKVKAN